MMSDAIGQGPETVCLRYDSDAPRTLVLEPWGDYYPLATGDLVDIVATGPTGGVLKVELEENALTVWAWSGSAIKASLNGLVLGGTGPRPAVPAVPEGSSVRGFLKVVQGDKPA